MLSKYLNATSTLGWQILQKNFTHEFILGCGNRSDRDIKRFSFTSRIPVIRYHYGEQEYRLSVKRRTAWLAAISRDDLDENKMDKYMICSKHFHSGKPAKPMDETNIDWVPTLHLGHNKRLSQSTESQVQRTDRAKKRSDKRRQAEEEELMFLEAMGIVSNEIATDTVCELIGEISFDTCEWFSMEATAMSMVTDRIIHEECLLSVKDVVMEEMRLALLSYAEGHCNCASQVAELQEEVKRCHEVIQDLSAKLEMHLPPFCEESLKDDSIVSFYTGLPNLKILKAIFNHVCITLPCERSGQCKLSKFQEYMLVMLKLRINCPLVDLSYRFNVSPSTVSRILHKWIVQIDIRLKGLIIWPERENLQKTMPNCFRLSFGKKVAIIIDCFEIFIERPSNLKARSSTWSNYKHRNTAKVLLGIVPQGSVAYVSETWGGPVSDKHLTENCGMLKKLLPGDIVLADRGFDIAESVGMMQARLHIPAFTKGKDQLSAAEVEETRTIANVRIHVERVIGMVRQKYSILHHTIPIDFVTIRQGEDIPIIDRIVRICCALNNVCNPIVPFD